MEAQATATKLRIGERFPFCIGMRRDKSFYSSEEQAGRPAVIILAGAIPSEALKDLIADFAARIGDFSALSCDLLVAVDGEASGAPHYADLPLGGIQPIFCLKDLFLRCGFDGRQPWVVVVDRNQRILGQIDPATTWHHAAAALAYVAALSTEPPRHERLPAPVLSVPHILSPAFCRALIERFESGATTPGGMASMDAFGHPIHKIDVSKKHRRDFVLGPDEALYAPTVDALSRACLPEMKKAFQFDATHLDRVLIACYDESGGYFRRHRDNVASAVSYRQFALSINLSDDYEGGFLKFPEYNDHTYRPVLGSGLVFSASLLHEATPITKGRRYVLLTFIHNSAAEAIRCDRLRAAANAA